MCVPLHCYFVCFCIAIVACASALLVVCASALLVVCTSALLVASVHCKVSFPSVVVCASALQCHVCLCIARYAFLQCSCVCGSGVTALVVIPRISQVEGS